MKQVLLDGELVSPDTIDPEIHKYIGMFRPATMSQFCPICGLLPDSTTIVNDHYIHGHFDIPQYVTQAKIYFDTMNYE
jgi:hypothetical protein